MKNWSSQGERLRSAYRHALHPRQAGWKALASTVGLLTSTAGARVRFVLSHLEQRFKDPTAPVTHVRYARQAGIGTVMARISSATGAILQAGMAQKLLLELTTPA